MTFSRLKDLRAGKTGGLAISFILVCQRTSRCVSPGLSFSLKIVCKELMTFTGAGWLCMCSFLSLTILKKKHYLFKWILPNVNYQIESILCILTILCICHSLVIVSGWVRPPWPPLGGATEGGSWGPQLSTHPGNFVFLSQSTHLESVFLPNKQPGSSPVAANSKEQIGSNGRRVIDVR